MLLSSRTRPAMTEEMAPKMAGPVNIRAVAEASVPRGTESSVAASITGLIEYKNIPSKVIHRGILHLLSPQLIQAPCGFRELRLSRQGMESVLHPICNKQVALLSKKAYGSSYPERHGQQDDRDFSWGWT